MPNAKPPSSLLAEAALSEPRVSTYLEAVGGDLGRAMELYAWNARVSAALMLPAHFAEVTVRNAVSDGLTAVHGPDWPWSPGLEIRLLDPDHPSYSPKRDLRSVSAQQTSTGKVVAELKFAFWGTLMTQRYDQHLWSGRIGALFPGVKNLSDQEIRLRAYRDLESTRRVRNRVAHHEPIFTRNLSRDLAFMLDLIGMRSPTVRTWVVAMEQASSVINERPTFAISTPSV